MRVLISGASVAGPTLAYWLARHGHEPTVVELAARPRAGGYPIDVRGQAVLVAERMGLLPALREYAVDTEQVDFVAADGRVRSTMPMRRLRAAASVRDLELLRGDLVRILHDATSDDVDYRFGDSIRTLRQDAAGVDVEFESGAAQRFDVVIGADGLHSQVRSLAFGPEADVTRYLGMYVGGAAVDPAFGVADRCVLHNVPGRAAGVYRFGSAAAAIFLFRTERPLHYDHRDVDVHKGLVADAFADGDWRVPELLADVLAAPDFYFDSVSQIRMPAWSNGRVALVGDAGYGPALLSGSGTTLAMAGAYLLAGELATADTPQLAFAAYEARHRPSVRRAQGSVGPAGAFMVPATEAAIRRRDRLVNWSGPQMAMARLSRYLPRRRVTLPGYRTMADAPALPAV